MIDQIRQAIKQAIPGAEVDVSAGAGPGHYNISVVSEAFEGKPMVQAHQLVYQAISSLMKGDRAPVHAIDQLQTSPKK